MDSEITNERLYLELRKNHRRLIAAVATVTLENILLIAVISGFFSALEAGSLLIGFLLLVTMSAQAIHKGGITARILDSVPFIDSTDSEPEIERDIEAK